FFPQQDSGLIQAITQAPQSVSFKAMSERQQAVARIAMDDPAVASVSSFIGVDGSNATLSAGHMQIALKPHAERDATLPEVMQRLQREFDTGQDGMQVYMQPLQDLTIEDRVARTQYQMTLSSPDLAVLGEWAPRLVERLNRSPELRDVAHDLQD